MGLLDFLNKEDDPFKNVADSSSNDKLSYIGTAAYKALRSKHSWYRDSEWNISTGKTIGALQQTPSADVFKYSTDPTLNHSDWFPEGLKEIMSKTTTWCDVMSLVAPDGIFVTKMKEALLIICENSKSKPVDEPIVVRLMLGNIPGMPANCEQIMDMLTEDLPSEANVDLWVGAWRKGVSWNHAKIIAVDGRYLHTGGHNLWEQSYLSHNPCHDISIEMEGRVAHDGHLVRTSVYVCMYVCIYYYQLFYLHDKNHSIRFPLTQNLIHFISLKFWDSMQTDNGNSFRRNNQVFLVNVPRISLIACLSYGTIASL